MSQGTQRTKRTNRSKGNKSKRQFLELSPSRKLELQKDKNFSYRTFKQLEYETQVESSNYIPKNISAFGVNYLTHQLLIGTDEIFKLYSTVTHKKLKKKINYSE